MRGGQCPPRLRTGVDKDVKSPIEMQEKRNASGAVGAVEHIANRFRREIAIEF